MKELKMWKVIFYAITNKSFKMWLQLTLEYAIRNHNEKRGEGASDVALFLGKYGDKIY